MPIVARFIIAFLHVVLLTQLVSGCSVIADTSPEKDLSTIMGWWDGDYQNDEQIARLEAAGKPVWRADGTGEDGHIEVTSHYRRIEMPSFGKHVIYVEETKHGDPNNVFRQRLYTLRVDKDIETVRVKIWNFKDKKKYVGAWRDLSRLDGLAPDDMSSLPDTCDLIAKKQGGEFHMPMHEQDCAFGDRYFSYQVLLGPDSFWFRDKIASTETDEVLESAGKYTYHELRRVN